MIQALLSVESLTDKRQDNCSRKGCVEEDPIHFNIEQPSSYLLGLSPSFLDVGAVDDWRPSIQHAESLFTLGLDIDENVFA